MVKKQKGEEIIRILGACQNNLKNVDVEIPADSLTVITGVSGSGKSSLAFDTLYAEGQRRYVESMSAYARQFLERIQKPSVRTITGISPSIAIRQKNTSRNPRSTVGTVTEIYDFLRLLYARIGTILCFECGREVRKDTVDKIIPDLMQLRPGTRMYISFPFSGSALDLTNDGTVELEEQLENLRKQGFHRLVMGEVGTAQTLHLGTDNPSSLAELSTCHVLLDRLVVESDMRDRLADSLEMSFAEGNGVVDITLLEDDTEGNGPRRLRFSENFECQHCHIPYRQPEARLFSFNNPYGACPTCHGFGSTITLDRHLIIPDPKKSLIDGPIEPFNKPKYRRFQKQLLHYAQDRSIPIDEPFEDLPEAIQRKIWAGDANYPGIKGFFDYLSTKKYKMHVRIFISRYRAYTRCPDCDGGRLRREAENVYVGGRSITSLTEMSIIWLQKYFDDLILNSEEQEVAARLLMEIKRRLRFLTRVGLGYLTLGRLTSSLSGGEMQRIHLAASLGSALVGTLYVLDEPSIGLHPRDQARLVAILRDLQELGNTIVIVEHEREIISSADRIIDVGPGAGEQGGEIVHCGDLSSLLRNRKSLTGRYLDGQLNIPIPVFRRTAKRGSLRLTGASQHNLKKLSLEIPLGVMVCVTGVSGSGKSTLVHDVLYAGIKHGMGRWSGGVGRFTSIEGWEALTDVLLVDQTPIGKTPRSNPVTYIKAFDEIRKLFASLRESRARNFAPGHFSFNVAGGRCETCQGAGTLTVEMQFLADVELQCENCRGTRFQPKILEIRYKGKNIYEVLRMTVEEALDFFSNSAPLIRKLGVLKEVGLGYLRLGQSATTLSGGEAQRMKLASYLSKPTSDRPLFIFDEPTTGLHFDDISQLLKAFDKLISKGGSLVVIEHNLDVIKSADWIIDLGPEGGDEGGYLVASGTPEEIARYPGSHTGSFLKSELQRKK
jgi:excinuclease ABC subunit A